MAMVDEDVHVAATMAIQRVGSTKGSMSKPERLFLVEVQKLAQMAHEGKVPFGQFIDAVLRDVRDIGRNNFSVDGAISVHRRLATRKKTISKVPELEREFLEAVVAALSYFMRNGLNFLLAIHVLAHDLGEVAEKGTAEIEAKLFNPKVYGWARASSVKVGAAEYTD